VTSPCHAVTAPVSGRERNKVHVNSQGNLSACISRRRSLIGPKRHVRRWILQESGKAQLPLKEPSGPEDFFAVAERRLEVGETVWRATFAIESDISSLQLVEFKIPSRIRARADTDTGTNMEGSTYLVQVVNPVLAKARTVACFAHSRSSVVSLI
jgi:hypothetical protein